MSALFGTWQTAKFYPIMRNSASYVWFTAVFPETSVFDKSCLLKPNYSHVEIGTSESVGLPQSVTPYSKSTFSALLNKHNFGPIMFLCKVHHIVLRKFFWCRTFLCLCIVYFCFVCSIFIRVRQKSY